MVRRIRDRIHSDENAFTLIELLVVVLIVGILAALALPAFLGQRQKSYDVSAKSDARNMVSEIESCYAGTQDYSKCQPPQNTDLNVGPGVGEVEVSAATIDSYRIVGHSRTTNSFTITKASSGATSRTCSNPGIGGCPTNGSW